MKAIQHEKPSAHPFELRMASLPAISLIMQTEAGNISGAIQLPAFRWLAMISPFHISPLIKVFFDRAGVVGGHLASHT
jgi:hypothetical protein